MLPFRSLLPLLAGTLCCASLAQAEVLPAAAVQAPLWEAGVAGVLGYVPDYPASDRDQLKPVPLPYFIYRGEFLRSDQGGVRVRALQQPRVEFDISFGASLASRSDGNDARAGMPNLDNLLEAGPNLRLILWRPDTTSRLSVELPVRSVISTDFLHFRDRGFLFAPRIGWLDSSLDGHYLRLQVQIGPDFATEKLQDYFYQVDPQYVRPGRPAFDAQGGYLGSNLDVSIARPVLPRVLVFASSRLSYFGAARNAGSPLFRDRFNYGFFAGFAWSIFQSDARVARAE